MCNNSVGSFIKNYLPIFSSLLIQPCPREVVAKMAVEAALGTIEPGIDNCFYPEDIKKFEELKN